MSTSAAMRRLLGALPAELDRPIVLKLPAQGSWPNSSYRLDPAVMHRLVAAAGAGRPLLVRGEPGVGKSSLARAAAALLEWPFLSFVVQPQTEYQDLLWTFDHTERLGRAQLLAHAGREDIDDALAPRHFICPGPLWWAFEPGWIGWPDGVRPGSCGGYAPDADRDGLAEADGLVLLIDEIDKADISLCNGLLEALGNGSFSVPPLMGRSVGDRSRPPLVIITSNDARELPAAFLRRCVLLDLVLPVEGLEDHFVTVGGVHFDGMDEEVRRSAARQIIKDRGNGSTRIRSGQAEYLDLLRVVDDIARTQPEADRLALQMRWLERLEGSFRKLSRASA